jgi:amino acid transporter
MIILVSIIIYIGSYFAFWILVKKKKRSQNYIRWASLVSLCPVIISACFIFDELENIMHLGENNLLIQIVILFILIYGFRLFQEQQSSNSD